MAKNNLSDNVGKVPEPILLHIQDAITSNGMASLVLEATHSGVLNLNDRFYSPVFMKNGANSFVHPKKKPVLVNHDMYSAPLGRVQKVEYINLVGEYNDSALTKLNKKVLAAKRSDSATRFSYDLYVMLKENGMLDDYGNTYQGLGFLRLFADIGDETAIARINDGRYDTVSVSFRPEKGAHCLECNVHMGTEDCDHNGYWNPAPLMPIGMRYVEVSFVNAGADILAGQESGDSEDEVYHNDMIFSDSIVNDTIVLTTREAMADNTQDVDQNEAEDNKDVDTGTNESDGDKNADTNDTDQSGDNRSTDNNENDTSDTEDTDTEENAESDTDSDENDDSGSEGDESDVDTEDGETDDAGDTEDNNEDENTDDSDANKKHIMSVIDKDKFVTAYNDFAKDLGDEYLLTAEDIESDDITYLGPNETFGILRAEHVDGMKQFISLFKGTGVEEILDALSGHKLGTDETVTIDNIDDLPQEQKQKIFDSLYDECSGDNEQHQELAAKILFHKYNSDSANKEAEAAENMYKDLFEKARGLIVQYIVDNKIAIGEINESDSEEYTKKISQKDNSDLLDLFGLFKGLEESNEENSDEENDEENSDEADNKGDNANSDEDNKDEKQEPVADKADIFRHLSIKVGKQKAAELMIGLEEINRRIN